ncbi:Ankyrin repeat domain-containing 50 protein [Apiospora arundinis]|uniref:Ankyrin repeat domain-containing 50 protein n=1 Tax=Apiospora arundinis TaxID=335852 RepID=A0ABR2JI49_9PEZI
MTYGYDTHIRHRLGPEGSQSTVYDISWDFLVALEASRRREPIRPIIFIAHSLGGIVVKEMLRRASIYRLGQSHLRPVFDSTKGVLFFGTPHGGSDPRGFLQKFAEQLFRATGFTVNQQIVNTLLPSSERLRELRDEFAPMARQQGWIIHSFQEQIGVKALSSDKVVDDSSSYLNAPDLEVTEHIGQNHMDMCRFVGPHDPEYRKVAAAITHITTAEYKIATDPMPAQEPPVDSEELGNILDLLRFEQHDARHHNIKSAHAKTCKWLLKSDSYLEWAEPKHIENHHGFFWIKGKPGTGKSTIMKFLLANAKRRLRGSLILTFFFNARGDALERSTIGLYRSLLLQIFEQKPSLRPILGTDLLRSKTGWSLELLKSVFEQAIQSIVDTPVVCIVDALDECPEKEVREMVSSFSHLGQLAASDERRFKVCFSSRHYPYITMDKKIELVLEENEGHSEDISQYVASELKIGQGKLADEVRETVRTKSSGIFMWVVLVVQILNKEHDTGRVYKIRQRLKEIPKDLHELFRDILSRDSRNGEELILCLQWVLFARRPLTPAELYSAVLSGVESDAIKDCDMEELSESDFDRYILDCSKGLVESTKTKHRTSQFIHESVRDFLLKDSGLISMITEDESHCFEALSHEKLKHCCFVRMEIGRSLYKPESRPTQFPFLRYAVDNILHHTDKAQELGRSQSNFLAGFPAADWVALNNLFERHEIRKYPPDARLVYILAEKNLYHLIALHQTTTSPLEMGQERYKCPLLAALVMGSPKASKELLSQVVEKLPECHRARLLFEELFSREDPLPSFSRDIRVSNKEDMYKKMVRNGHTKMMLFLVSVGMISDDEIYKSDLLRTAGERRQEVLMIEILKRVGMDLTSSRGEIRKPYNNRNYSLQEAAQDGVPRVVRLILETTGTNELNSRDIFSQTTPLESALVREHPDVVEVLLEFGADPNGVTVSGDSYLLSLIKGSGPRNYIGIETLLALDSLDTDVRDEGGRTPLMWAVIWRDEKVTKLILDSGKGDINACDESGRTSLSHAANFANIGAIKLLLSFNADGSICDDVGRTPLSWAVDRDSIEAVELLLNAARSDVNFCDNKGRTPLSRAVKKAARQIVKILVNSDKTDVDTRDESGRTPLSYLMEMVDGPGTETEVSDIIDALLITGRVDINSRDNLGRTPLSWTATAGWPDTACPHIDQLRFMPCALLQLIENGADPAIRDEQGRTACDWYETFKETLGSEYVYLDTSASAPSEVQEILGSVKS